MPWWPDTAALRKGWWAPFSAPDPSAAKKRHIRQKALEALKFMGVGDYADTVASNLPYGLQRRLEIARALAAQPKVILLDEPAAGMNPSESSALMKDIARISELGIDVLLVEHDMKVVMGVCQPDCMC
jgi:branched-chain amino acid transport system ATP-binding protein